MDIPDFENSSPDRHAFAFIKGKAFCFRGSDHYMLILGIVCKGRTSSHGFHHEVSWVVSKMQEFSRLFLTYREAQTVYQISPD
jgi:hypothetical protein